ncbi:36103_t:CDS:2 [Gigaspora margarita]|uniref:36103_t:CDS:1 n=1 Tax=Gigaspora margarita TaxID=4874 RepID=A0ABN7UE62_GIGMA|nr:36103_t:CDS:2 [Gigaspora margarita]
MRANLKNDPKINVICKDINRRPDIKLKSILICELRDFQGITSRKAYLPGNFEGKGGRNGELKGDLEATT